MSSSAWSGLTILDFPWKLTQTRPRFAALIFSCVIFLWGFFPALPNTQPCAKRSGTSSGRANLFTPSRLSHFRPLLAFEQASRFASVVAHFSGFDKYRA